MKNEYMKNEPILSGDEEVIAKPATKEFSDAEIQMAVSEMTFYGSSKWHEMVKKWRDEHPTTPRVISIEEQKEMDEIINQANIEWREMKKEKERIRTESEIRRQKVIDEANIKLSEEREKLLKKRKYKK